MFCLPLFLLDLIPIPVTALLLLGCIALGLSAAGKRWGRWTFAIILSLPPIALLAAWMLGITAECDRAFSPTSRILNPRMVSTLHALTILCGITVVFTFLYWACTARERSAGIRGVIAALAMVVTLMTIECNLFAFRHIFGTYGVIPVFSPDHTREARFVPIDHWFDGVAGIIIWRNVGEFWWHPAYELPEELHPDGILRWKKDGSIEFFDQKYNRMIAPLGSTTNPASTFIPGNQ